jgi:RNA polymerase sigma-70 factor (ECF subfamily)
MGEDRELEEVRRVAAGDREELGALLARHEARLQRIITLRLDPRLRNRVEPRDVVQSTHLQALRRIDEYLGNPTMPFFLWLRFLAIQEVLALQRQHLGTQARDVRREIRFLSGGEETTTQSLVHHVMMSLSTPSRAAMRAEQQAALAQALEQMDPIDREVLALRHIEQLSNAETARELGLEEAAASKRYVRALRRLRELFGSELGA